MLDRADDRQFAPANAGFAHTSDTLVGIDRDEQEVAPSVPQRIDFDISGLYRSLLPDADRPPLWSSGYSMPQERKQRSTFDMIYDRNLDTLSPSCS